MTGAPPLFELVEVTVHRGDTRVLDRFTLSVPSGRHLAILGPNGSGKSTVIQLLTRDLHPVHRPETIVRVLGRDRWLLFDLRAQLGIVSNDLMAACTRRITGMDVALSGFFGSIGLWPHHAVTDAMRYRAAALLDELEVGHLAARPVKHMSSGEARRLLIARALVHEPAALVLDEPFNSLDLKGAHEVRRTLRYLAGRGTKLVLVTHHLADIIPEIDHVVLMREGRVAAEGPKAEMLTSPRLSALFGAPVTVERRDGFYHAW